MSEENPLHQCNSCKLEGKRSCTYHGYPRNNIPDSCSYKIGCRAEEALKNLNGTYIDIWTKDHDQQIRAQVLEEVRQAALSATVQEFKDDAYVYRIDAFKFDGLLTELKGDVRK